MTDIGGKYTLNPACDWCSKKPAREFLIQTNGVKTKRFRVTAMACAKCARRLGLDDSK